MTVRKRTPTEIGAHTGRPAEPFPLVAVRDVSEIVEQDWLVEGLLPRFDEGAAGYLFGPAKARKSLLLADIALSVTSGTRALGRYAVPHAGAAVGFFAEDPKGETSRRIHRMARARGIGVPARLHLLNIPTLSLDNAGRQQRLLATLTAVPDLAFVWLDPMVRLHTVDDNRANELGPIHTFLRALSRACPSAVLALSHHANKLGDSRGSTDYPAFGDFNLYCRRVDDHTTEVFRVENRGGPPGQSFRFGVEDGEEESGATLRLVVHDDKGEMDEAARDRTVAEAIAAFRGTQPGQGGRACLESLKAHGVKVGSDRFWRLWKKAISDDPDLQ